MTTTLPARILAFGARVLRVLSGQLTIARDWVGCSADDGKDPVAKALGAEGGEAGRKL